MSLFPPCDFRDEIPQNRKGSKLNKNINETDRNAALLRTSSFKHALQKTMNQDLTAMLQGLLDVSVDDMEYQDNDFKMQNRKLKRVLSLPTNIVSKGGEANQPYEMMKNHTSFKLRRRQTFPAPSEYREWKFEQKDKHVL